MWVMWAGLGFRIREEQVREVSDQEGGSWHGSPDQPESVSSSLLRTSRSHTAWRNRIKLCGF